MSRPNLHKPAKNASKPIKHVKFFQLKPIEQGSAKSYCPVCKDGLLPMNYNKYTKMYVAEDTCVRCTQLFIYDDIDLVNKKGIQRK